MSGKKHRKAQQEREVLEREEAARMQRKRWIALGGCLVVLGLIGFAVVRWLREPAPTDVNGRLGGIHRISFQEGSQANSGISPVCGCAHPHLNAWRGVEFAGREVTLTNVGSPWAQWVISSAEPTLVGLSGGEDRVKATAVRLRSDGRFDPFSLIGPGPPPRTVHVQRRVAVEAEKFSMLTPSTMRIALPGSVPVGAWIPFPGSWVDLTETRSPFPGSPRQQRLVEHYPAEVGFRPDEEGEEHPKEPQIFPLGDFLGPDLVLWSDNPQARVVGTAFNHRAGKGVITAVVMSPSVFSTRIAVAPAPSGVAEDFEGYYLGEEGDLAEWATEGTGEPGTLTLDVARPLTEDEYEGLRQRVRSNPRTWSVVPPNPRYEGPYEHRGFWREEHFPPMPRQAGFNVWGPLQAIDLDQVHGSLTVGDKNVDLSGSGDVELDDVQAFHNPDGDTLVTAPLATSGRAADLQFEAHGTVSVNGAAQSTTQSQFEPVWGAVLIFITVVGFAISVGGLVRFRTPAGPVDDRAEISG